MKRRVKEAVAVGLAMSGVISVYLPGYNGLWAEPDIVSDGEGSIAGAVYLVGACILWFMPTPPTK